MNVHEAAPYIVALAGAWIIAHLIKGITAVAQRRKLTLVQLLSLSGGMPSSHAATSIAVWTAIAMTPEVPGALIGLATLVVVIICYDAVKVRRSTGEQGEALRALLIEQKSPITLPRAARGHTPIEVVVGACVGMVVGFVVYSTMLSL